ncbi:UbiD family decarboxylase, partial [Candidatus Micrarchaeota archaeon]|nr:UbiD family decarboxylase [Candidatus Micrarchaeota archaeon]
MSFRDFINKLKNENKIVTAKKQVSLKFEAASVLKKAEPCPVFLPKIKESGYSAAGNIFSSKELIAESLGIKKEELMKKLSNAVKKPSEPELISRKDAPVMKNTIDDVDLFEMPVPVHLKKDGGPYFTSAVVIANDPEYGRNCSFHRMMVVGKDKLTARILERHFNEYILRAEKRNENLPFAFCVGNSINVLLAGAVSSEIENDELKIADALHPLKTVKLGNGI